MRAVSTIGIDTGGKGRRYALYRIYIEHEPGLLEHRQNGVEMSADALGYPESYYSPPIQAVEQIEIVRGAASLQYGTQFGGLINFKLKDAPEDK